MVMDANQIYCANPFAVYTSTESLCCIPEINTMLYAHYISIKKKPKLPVFPLSETNAVNIVVNFHLVCCLYIGFSYGFVYFLPFM